MTTAATALNFADLVVGEALHDEIQADHQADKSEYGDDADGHGGGGNFCQGYECDGKIILECNDYIGKDDAHTDEAGEYDYTEHYADDAHEITPYILI